MERIAHPRGVKSVRREGLVVLHPDFFIFERVGLAEFAAEVPCEGLDFPTLLHVLDNDGEIGFLAQ